MPHFPTLAGSQTSQVAEALHIAAPVSNSMVFEQIDDMSYFLMDESQTYSDHDPMVPNITDWFNLGGIWLQPVDIG